MQGTTTHRHADLQVLEEARHADSTAVPLGRSPSRPQGDPLIPFALYSFLPSIRCILSSCFLTSSPLFFFSSFILPSFHPPLLSSSPPFILPSFLLSLLSPFSSFLFSSFFSPFFLSFLSLFPSHLLSLAFACACSGRRSTFR